MPTLAKLDSATWKKLKADAGVANNKIPFFSDGSVGKHVEAFQKARAAIKAHLTVKNWNAFMGALDKLEAAFTKFVKEKNKHGDLDTGLLAEIQAWQLEIAAKRNKWTLKAAQEGIAKMQDNDALEMKDILKEIV